jgi:hypothetical protein
LNGGKELTMKKLIVSLAALAALGTGAAFAQGSADCQAGSAWGNNCTLGNPATPIAGNSGWQPPWGYDPANQGYYDVPPVVAQSFPGLAYGYPQYSDGTQVWTDPRTGRQYSIRPRANDRDGDGVRNNRDRYPDDPRYR